MGFLRSLFIGQDPIRFYQGLIKILCNICTRDHNPVIYSEEICCKIHTKNWNFAATYRCGDIL